MTLLPAARRRGAIAADTSAGVASRVTGHSFARSSASAGGAYVSAAAGPSIARRLPTDSPAHRSLATTVSLARGWLAKRYVSSMPE